MKTRSFTQMTGAGKKKGKNMEKIKQEKSDRTYTVDSRRNMKKKVLMTISKMDATKKLYWYLCFSD